MKLNLRRRILLTILSALLLSLCFCRFSCEWLAWISLIPWLAALTGQSCPRRAGLSFLWGSIFFLSTLYWLAQIHVAALLTLGLWLALFPVLFGLACADVYAPRALWLLPLYWIALEWIRCRIPWGGFGWALLGHTQYQWLSLIQLADCTGVAGISAVVAVGNIALLHLLRKPHPRPAALLLLLPAALAYGQLRLHTRFSAPPIKICVVQGNIAQEKKWNPLYAGTILRRYRQLTLQASELKPDLIVWPETAVPGYVLNNRRLAEAVRSIIRQAAVPVLLGSVRADARDNAYNSALLFDRRGRLVQRSDKMHLVPFGEYIPGRMLRRFLTGLGIGEFSPGRQPALFALPDIAGTWGVLICFEDTISGLAAQIRRRGADFLITITNEGWFARSDELRQHLAISVFRAVENRCWLVRCANTGISGFIDPYGRIRAVLKQNNADNCVAGVAVYTLD